MATFKWIFGGIGAILLGVLTNALWDLVFRPLCLKLGPLSIKIATFGMTSLIDKLYVQAAQRAPMKSLPFLYLAPIGIMFLYIFCSNGAYSNWVIATLKQSEAYSSSVVANNKPIPITRELIEQKIRRETNDKSLAAFSLLFYFVLLAFSIIRTASVSKTINYFDQCLASARPFITEPEAIQYMADFANMKTQEEYLKIVASLHFRVAASEYKL